MPITAMKSLVKDAHLQAVATTAKNAKMSEIEVNKTIRNYLEQITQQPYCHCESGCELGTQHKRAEELLNLILWADKEADGEQGRVPCDECDETLGPRPANHPYQETDDEQCIEKEDK